MVGYLMDSSLLSEDSPENMGFEGDAAKIDYKSSFVKINAFLCCLDGLAFIILTVWCIMQPRMLNKASSTENSQSDSSERKQEESKNKERS